MPETKEEVTKDCVEFYLNLTQLFGSLALPRSIYNFVNIQVTLLVFFIFFMVFQCMIKLDQMIYKCDSCCFNYIFVNKYNRNITIDINHGEKHFSYNFWYQPYHNIKISREWCHPNAFSNRFNPQGVANGLYGHILHFWDWKKHKIIETVIMTLETRFMDNSKSSHAFVTGALSSNIIHCYKTDKTNGNVKYIQVPGVDMENWIFATLLDQLQI